VEALRNVDTSIAAQPSRMAWAGSLFLVFVASDLVAGLSRGAVPRSALVPLALASLIVSLPLTHGLALWVSLGMLSVGLAIAATEGLWATWLVGMMDLAPVLALVTFAQLLTVPIELGGYHEKLVRMLERGFRRRSSRLHVAVFAAFLLGCLATAGALAACYRVLVRPDDGEETRRAVLCNAMRGVGAAISLTPATGTFGVTMAITGVSVLALLVLAAPASAIIILLAILSSCRASFPGACERAEPADSRRLAQFGVGLLVLVAVTLVVGRSPGVSPLHAIVLSLVLVSLAWGALLDRAASVRRLVVFPTCVAGNASTYALFVTAGGLAAVIGTGRWHEHLVSGLLQVSAWVPAWLAVAGLIWLLFHLGIHPAVSVALVAPVALTTQLVSPRMMALLAMTATGTAVISSPFGGVAALAASMSGQSIFRVSIAWHVAFSLAALVVTTALAQLFPL